MTTSKWEEVGEVGEVGEMEMAMVSLRKWQLRESCARLKRSELGEYIC